MKDLGYNITNGELQVSEGMKVVLRVMIAALLAVIFLLDLSFELGVAVGMLFVVPIILSALLNDERLTVTLAFTCSILTVLAAPLKPVNFPQALDVVLPNRSMMLIIIWASTIISLLLIRRTTELHRARDGLHVKVEERTQELSSAVKRLEHEVTERNRAEEELQRAHDVLEARVIERTKELANEKERLSTTLISIGDAVIATDVEERITIMNRVAEQLTGWSVQEALGKPLDDVFIIVNERTREKAISPVKQVLGSGSTIDLANHTMLISRDGSERAIGDSGAPVIDPDGKVAGVVLVFRDMTKELKSMEELERAQRLESLGILAGGIAHDFNNVLTALEGNVTIARIRAGENREVVEKLTEAENACKKARHLTRQLITFAKGGEPVRRTIDIKDLLVDNTRFALTGSNLRTKFLIQNDLWNVEADEGQLSQVIHNLILNAKEAMPQGGTIEVHAENAVYKPPHSSAHAPGKYVKISIIDDGIGIPPNYLKKVFDPYFSTKQDGRGLGLTIVFSIIGKHDGYLQVDSKVGVGTRFTFYLPEARSSSDVRSPDLIKAPNESSKMILWMDDEEAILDIGKEILSIMGYGSKMVKDGKEALEQYRKSLDLGRPFDAVLLDLTIPGGMGGEETILKLNEIDPNVRAIVCSGYSSDPVMANHQEYGFTGVLQKPFTINELSRVLQEVIDRGRSSDL